MTITLETRYIAEEIRIRYEKSYPKWIDVCMYQLMYQLIIHTGKGTLFDYNYKNLYKSPQMANGSYGVPIE